MPTYTYQVGSFDIARFSDAELWAKMNGLARVYAGLNMDFRLLAYSRPFPLDEPLEILKEMMAHATDPRAREQIAAYRRFVEQIVQAAYLKDTTYYLLLFPGSRDDRSPQVLGNILANELHLPVQHVPDLPALGADPCDEHPVYIRPATPRGRGPHVAFLHSYDIRGEVHLATTIHFLKLPFPLFLAVDVKTVPRHKAIRTLQFAYNKLRADLLGRSGNEAPDPEMQQGYADVQETMALVNSQRLGLHQVGLAFAVLGDTRRQLAERVDLLLATAESNQVYLRRAWCQQDDVYTLFTTGRAPDTVTRHYRNMDSRGAASLASTGHEARKITKGPFVAINLDTGSPLWLDRFAELPAYNEAILGRTGSGKTFMAGLLAYRELMFGVQTVFIDPQGNFQKITEAAGGKYNYLRLGVGTALNILDVVHDHQAAQVSHVLVMLEALLGRPLALPEKGAVDRALGDLYGQIVIAGDGEPDLATMPRLEDLVAKLRTGSGYESAPALAADLERFVDGSLREIFNAHTTLSFDLDRRYPIITFDVSDLEGEFQPALIFALLSSVERSIRQRRREQLATNVVLDEFFILSQIPTLARAAGALAKRVRAWKVGIQCLDQNWGTFDTPAGRQILENTLVKVVMRVDATAAPAIVEALGLTDHHAEVILTAGVGEGILILENKPYHVYFQASRSEVEMLTLYTPPPAELIELPTRRK